MDITLWDAPESTTVVTKCIVAVPVSIYSCCCILTGEVHESLCLYFLPGCFSRSLCAPLNFHSQSVREELALVAAGALELGRFWFCSKGAEPSISPRNSQRLSRRWFPPITRPSSAPAWKLRSRFCKKAFASSLTLGLDPTLKVLISPTRGLLFTPRKHPLRSILS